MTLPTTSISRVPTVRWDVNLEMGFTDEGEFNPVWVRVECPTCSREGSPLTSCLTRKVDAGWKWVGISYQAPYSTHIARCPGCKEDYRFTTYIPQ